MVRMQRQRSESSNDRTVCCYGVFSFGVTIDLTRVKTFPSYLISRKRGPSELFQNSAVQKQISDSTFK